MYARYCHAGFWPSDIALHVKRDSAQSLMWDVMCPNLALLGGNMRAHLILAAALAMAGVAHSATVEVWECRDRYSPSGILAEAKVNQDRATGTISVAGVVHKARYEVKGFNRRWDFGERNDAFSYAFVVEPDGSASYFDFGTAKSVKPSMFMQCKQRPAVAPQSKPIQPPLVAKSLPNNPKWRNVDLWRWLNRQMSKEDVQVLLGPPTKIADSGTRVVWYYGYPFGGEVVFNNEGAIDSWREP